MALEGYQLIIVECFLIPISLVLIILRLSIRIRRRGIIFSWADFFVVFAWIAVTAEVCLDITEWRKGFFAMPNPFRDTRVHSPTEYIRDVQLFKILYAEAGMYFIVMYSIKFSLLCFYTEIIPRALTKTWYTMWGVVVFTVVSFVASEMLKLFWCIPLSRNWSLDPEQYCLSGADFTVGLITTILHFMTDIMIYVLPFPLLRVIALTERQKWGLRFTFGVGFLCVVFCIAVALTNLYSASSTVSWITVIFEYFWANLVVCLPAFKSFLKANVWRKVRSVVGKPYKKGKGGSGSKDGSGGELTRHNGGGGDDGGAIVGNGGVADGLRGAEEGQYGYSYEVKSNQT